MDSVSYGIGVTNRYDLFVDDETDPLEALKIIEQEKAAKKKTKLGDKENNVQPAATQAKPKVAPVKKPPPKAPAPKPQDSKVSPKGNGPKPNFENREDRNNKRNGEVKPRSSRPFDNNQTSDRPRGTSPRDNASENRRGRPLGARNGGRVATRRTFEDRRGKREFDRQSGSDKTGVKPVDKRDGGGPHNWGSDKDVIDEVNKSNEEPNVEEKVESADNNEEAAKETEVGPVEEEVKQLTLEEWKAQRINRSKPQYNLRKAGEGEDQTQWKKMYELNKKALADQDSDDEEYDPSEYPQRAGKLKHVRDISFYFNDTRRGGAFRGRGGRGGRNNNRFREEQQGQEEEDYSNKSKAPPAPKVDDERAFPSLG